jgi:ABC-type sugar transport system substrate-binding protein
MKKSTTLALTAIAFAASAATSAFAAETVIGLITKTDSNPFFVKMKEGAEAAAKKAAPSCSALPVSKTATPLARSPPWKTWLPLVPRPF